MHQASSLVGIQGSNVGHGAAVAVCSHSQSNSDSIRSIPFERHDLLANIRESVAGNLAKGATTAALLEPHELTNLIETETEALRTLDEPNSEARLPHEP
jgi:hypothetical protein